MPVPLHSLGKNGPKVPALGFGLMGMSYQSYGTVPGDDERFALLDRAVEIGATFWDTADLYGDGEALIGKWFKRTGKRNEIFLATKFGFLRNGSYGVDSSAAYCKEACEKSLKDLGIETIDLYYLHNANPETPIEETMRALAELKAEGKIKYIGLSNITSATLRRAVKIAPVTAVQTEYSVVYRGIEGPESTNLLATCRELGIPVVLSSPLGRGLLTNTFSAGDDVGDAKDLRVKSMPRFLEENRAKNVTAINQFKSLADKKGVTVSQLSLAWLLKQGDDIFPIPGTKKVKYLEENWAVGDIVLTDAEEKEIREVAEKIDLAGDTIPAAFAAYAYRDTKEEST